MLVGQNTGRGAPSASGARDFCRSPIRSRGWSISLRPRKRRQTIKPEDFILFNQQFVALIKAGLPILQISGSA